MPSKVIWLMWWDGRGDQHTKENVRRPAIAEFFVTGNQDGFSVTGIPPTPPSWKLTGEARHQRYVEIRCSHNLRKHEEERRLELFGLAGH